MISDRIQKKRLLFDLKDSSVDKILQEFIVDIAMMMDGRRTLDNVLFLAKKLNFVKFFVNPQSISFSCS